MSINWPATFPHPTLQGYSLAPDESIARTTMESGVARQRRRFTSVPSKVDVRWLMESGTFGLFEAWYRHKAKEGAEWIIIDLMNGLGYNGNQARFLKPYAAKIVSGDLWEVTASLEIREMAVLSEGLLDIVLDLELSPEDLEPSAASLHQLVHVELPGIYEW